MSECDEIREWLPASLEDELAPEPRARVEAHLVQCADCARDAALLRETVQRVRALPVPEPPARFWEAFEASVQQRIAAESPPRRSVLGRAGAWLRGLPGLRPLPALAAATAVGLLLAIGLARAPREPRDLPPVDFLGIAEDLGIGQNLELLEHLELLEDLDVLERLPLLGIPTTGRPPRMG